MKLYGMFMGNWVLSVLQDSLLSRFSKYAKDETCLTEQNIIQ